MYLRTSIYFFLITLLVSCRAQQPLDVNQEQIVKTSWETREITEGATWKYYHFDSLFSSKQSITVLDIDLDEAIRVSIPHLDSGFSKTSTLAEQEGAFAAINGSFFNTRTGGTVVYFYKEGHRLFHGEGSIADYRDNAGFTLDREGNVSIIKKPAEGWQALYNPYTVLSSGPMLVYDGEIVEQKPEKFNTNRHPRTAVGLTKDNHLIAVVVDGRSSQAYGMNIEELSTLMMTLGCTVAMNLDGGGSSTAWIQDQTYNGVVNYPSDNKQFDHDGEREVANAIVFIKIRSKK